MHGFYAAKIDSQNERNRFLKSEIAKLDKEIAEINKLKDEIPALLGAQAGDRDAADRPRADRASARRAGAPDARRAST